MKWGYFACMAGILAFLAFACCETVRAEELEDYDYTDVEEQVEDYGITFMDIAKQVIKGDFSGALRSIGQAVADSIFGDFARQREIIIKILLVGVIGAVFKNLSGAFLGGGPAQTGSYIVQIALIFLMSGGVILAVDGAKELIGSVMEFMEALIPTYAIVITAGSGSATAIAFYELVMLVIFLVDKIMLHVILPGISIYMIINMMNYLSKEGSFTRLSELILEILGWGNKSLLGIVIGLNVIKGLISPILDSLKGSAFSKAVSLIPGIGGAVNAVTGVIIGSGALIKNTVGVTAMLLLVMICAVPVVKLFCFTYGCKAAGAVLEPVAEKNYTECINGMYEGLKLLLVSVCNVMILFLLTIAIVCSVSNAAFYAGN